MTVTYTSADAIADPLAETYDVLRARFRDLAGVIDVVSAERQALWTEIRRREREVAIQLRLGALTEEQKQEYKAIINSPSFSQG